LDARIVRAALSTVTALGLLAVWSQTALPATSQPVTARDKLGDVSRPGDMHARDAVDIASVTLTRPTEDRLRVVIETVGPLRPDTWVSFRYSDQRGYEDTTLGFYVSRGGPIHWHPETRRVFLTGRGKRFVLTIDVGPGGAVEWYPRFRWQVAVRSLAGPFHWDEFPNQHPSTAYTDFAWFPR
jgi:hypothetical protein